jgi:4-hydroxy-3-polyprenylbenzoate decarboxylase
VDDDVDIYNDWEILWSLNTRVDPATDIITIPGLRGHPMDPSGAEFGETGQPGWQRINGKAIIDATRPPTNDPRRDVMTRIKPPGFGEVRLADFLS